MHSPKIERIEQAVIDEMESKVINKYGLGFGNRKQRRAAKSKLVKDIKKLGKRPASYKDTLALLNGDK